MMNRTARLRALARLHGIQTAYFNVHADRVYATNDALEALLTSLNVAALTEQECDESLRIGIERRRATLIEPVIIAWDGVIASIDVRSHSTDLCLPRLQVATEQGELLQLETDDCKVEELTDAGTARIGFRHLRIHINLRILHGYHHLVCTTGNMQTASLLISAPKRCFGGETDNPRQWGLFAPLYALRSSCDWGAGSYTELESLCEYTARMGGHLSGTLPLLPCFFDSGDEPSPYLPITRLFWSEFYIDVARIPFLSTCREALAILDSREFIASRQALTQSPRVNYPEVLHLKRAVLSTLHRHVAATDSLQRELKEFLTTQPLASDYAAFRATADMLRTPRPGWPEWDLPGNTNDDRRQDEARHYHEFVQWMAAVQMDRCVDHAASQDVGLYLDLPVGVHPQGYDTWHTPDSFVAGVEIGAPPDSVFTTGQKWGSPPLHPKGIRENKYAYVRAYLQHHMRSARVLRIDHVMAMHRIYSVPDGFSAAEGAYIRYRPEEMYAIVSIESHRHNTIIIGEDLGTVPQVVRRSMMFHGLNRMFVLYYELDGLAGGCVPSISANCMASINTHDMPTFASMWQGLDIQQQVDVGILKSSQVRSAISRRTKAKQTLLRTLKPLCPSIENAQKPEAVLRCVLGWLGTSRAKYTMVNIEDLWLETTQQNIPSVGSAYASWRHKAARTLEAAQADPTAGMILEMLREAMKRTSRRPGGE